MKKKEAWARANLEDRVLGVAQGGNDRGILLPQERTRAQHLPDLRLRCSRARLIEKTPKLLHCCARIKEKIGMRKNSCEGLGRSQKGTKKESETDEMTKLSPRTEIGNFAFVWI